MNRTTLYTYSINGRLCLVGLVQLLLRENAWSNFKSEDLETENHELPNVDKNRMS